MSPSQGHVAGKGGDGGQDPTLAAELMHTQDGP